MSGNDRSDTKQFRPMRIQARPGSLAERYYYSAASPSGEAVMPKAIAPGLAPSPEDDLVFHGGKVVPQMEFQNVYLGGTASWKTQDIANIDAAIQRAMQDAKLNNVMRQYFNGTRLACDMRPSFIVEEIKPLQLDEPAVQDKVIQLFDAGMISKADLSTCIFNLLLPPGTVLRLDASSSLQGLGGYHGSVHIQRGGQRVTLYYSANVFSEIRPGMSENGIVAFNKPWKNVVGTLYHELNEFRTDADVNDFFVDNQTQLLGWTSSAGMEVGDQPIAAAGSNLHLVFREVTDAASKKRVPVQFLYSNHAHGAEGPINASA